MVASGSVAKVKLLAGAEVDLLSPEEHKAAFQELEDYFREADGTTIIRAAASFLTNSSGNTTGAYGGGNEVYRVPDGFHAYLTRLSGDYEGSTFKTPQSCDFRYCADYLNPSALRDGYSQLPWVFTYSRSHAPLFLQGQIVVVGIQGGPASTAIYCTAQVILVPTSKVLGADVLERYRR